jgi:serine protease Do
VGVVTAADRTRAIVPAATLVAETDRLLAGETPALGWLGVDVAPLTPALTRVTGASTGVIVASIDPRSPAASTLRVGDIVESIDGDAVESLLHWQAHVRRLSAGQRLALRVRSMGAVRDVTVAAAAPPPQVRRLSLGLDLRRVTQGSEVVRVAPGSVADAAGVRPGDVIVHAGEATAPAPAQLRRMFAAAAVGQPLLIAIDRGGTHHVMPLEKDAPGRP